MRFRMLMLMTVLALAVQCAFAADGTTSALYLTSGDSQTIFKVKGTSIVGRWTARNHGEYAIAVSSGTVRTAGDSSKSGTKYTLSGTPLSLDALESGTYDGTTNGKVNYGINYDTGEVFQANLDWSNPQDLFVLNAASELGITYDSSNNSLWVGGFGSGEICDYTLEGVVLSCFATPQSVDDQALALDPADGTLWITERTLNSTIVLDQYSKEGTFLQQISLNAGEYQNILGGEFAPGSSAP